MNRYTEKMVFGNFVPKPNPAKNLIFYEKTQDSWIQDWLLTCNEQNDGLKFKE